MAQRKAKRGLLGSLVRFPSEVLPGIADAADKLLKLNPKKKRKATKAPSRKQLAARRKFVAMVRARAKLAKAAKTGRTKKRSTKKAPSPAQLRARKKFAAAAKARARAARKGKRNPLRFKTEKAYADWQATTRRAKPKRKKLGIRKTARAIGRNIVRGLGTMHNPPTRTGIYAPFHGRQSTGTVKLNASKSVPGDVDILGGLKDLIIGQDGHAKKKVSFNPSKHMLAASRSGTRGRYKLHVLGARFKHRSNPGTLHDIGEIRNVTYVTRKNHLDKGQLIHYTHALKAPYPRLCVDSEGLPVIHDPKGGRQINARGIID